MRSVHPSHLHATYIAWRFYLLIFFILLIVAALIARVFDLSVIKHPFLLKQGNARALRVVNTPAFRGMITDRHGYPLAVSTSVYSIWMNPKEFTLTPETLKALSQILEMKKSAIKALVKRYQNKNREFAYLKRDVSPQAAAKVKALAIPGLHQQQDYRRFYPEGEVAAHVVGFTDIDDHGQEGLELAYNQWLSGVPGKKVVIKDRMGRVVSEVRHIQDQKSGNNLALSIHRRLQYLAYCELMEGVKKNLASSGSLVVLDVKTGEVLAMVNYPSFNPNNRVHSSTEALRNRAMTDIFEPGSTIKAFSVASALDSGLFKPDTVIDTYPGWIRVGKNIVRDEHRKGPMTITQILQVSSNVGITKMILSLPPNHLRNMLHSVGFGTETSVGFPGERSGILIKRDKWAPFAVATLAFGYGVSVTTLQLAQAYAVIAADGIKVPVSLMKVETAPQGKRVMNLKVAQQMKALLETVVGKGGTARSADIPGYRVAGKTGTAKMVGPHGYEKRRYTSSFVGMAPASDPRFVIAVVIHDPRGEKYYGGDVSAPVFKNVMEGALRMKNIPPDDAQSLVQNKEVAAAG